MSSSKPTNPKQTLFEFVHSKLLDEPASRRVVILEALVFFATDEAETDLINREIDAIHAGERRFREMFHTETYAGEPGGRP